MATAILPAELGAGTWIIDPTHSSISFSVRFLMLKKVRGRFQTFSGEITMSEDGNPSVIAEVAVASVNTGIQKRDTHIKSVPFFDVAHHPTATFTSTGFSAGGESHIVEGKFTLNGITRPVELAVVLNEIKPARGPGTVARFTASGVLKRTEFGVVAPLKTGSVVIGDTVAVALHIQAQQEA